MTKTTEKPTGLQLLRVPFADNHISKLPKPTKAQTDAVKADFKAGKRCQLCGAWHHPDVVHLDYVGHAALTDRLLDADPMWSWEPAALMDGLPAFDKSGGLWIKLTVCGVTRLGYGHAAPKPTQDPGAREKEVIGDALRNAAMRFGAALDLWHKGDLHGHDTDAADTPRSKPTEPAQAEPAPAVDHQATFTRLSQANAKLSTLDKFNKFWKQEDVKAAFDSLPEEWRDKMQKEHNTKSTLMVRAAMQDDDTPAGYRPPSFDNLEK